MQNFSGLSGLGGSGYLGSKIVDRLLAAGHQVTGTKRQHSDLSRVHMSGIKWIPASEDALEAVFAYTDFDCVINMACNYGKNGVQYEGVLEANIEFPLKVLNKSVENGIKRFITVGTGLPDRLNMYSFSKKMFSEFGKFYAEEQGIDFYDVQLQMFYGADEPPDRFLPSIIRRMICGAEVNMTLGTQKRDIIAVDDIIKAVFLILNSRITGYHEIPVGTGIAPTISEIADFIWNVTEKRSKLNLGAVPMRADEPDCVADISGLKKLGLWEPVDWKTGLQEMIEKIKEEMCCGVQESGRME